MLLMEDTWDDEKTGLKPRLDIAISMSGKSGSNLPSESSDWKCKDSSVHHMQTCMIIC